MKLLAISMCKQCRYMKEYLKSMPICMWPANLPNREIIDLYSFPDWCPLPDMPEQN